MKITQNAQGMHIFKRNIYPAIREKSAFRTTNSSYHTIYQRLAEPNSNHKTNVSEILRNPTMLREMLSL